MKRNLIDIFVFCTAAMFLPTAPTAFAQDDSAIPPGEYCTEDCNSCYFQNNWPGLRHARWHHHNHDAEQELPAKSSYYWPGRLFVKEWQQGDQRAGCPQRVSLLARPSYLPCECGYYVGGASPWPWAGKGVCQEHGTWGWDYVGRRPFTPHVILGYRRHCETDADAGYRTDGPKIFHRE